MENTIFLDRHGDLPAPSNIQIIETEVEFLQRAIDDAPMLIRGEKLCAWAEAFYRLRGQSFQYLESPSAALRHVFPSLTHQQAIELAQKIGQETISPEKINPAFVLLSCYPSDSLLWKLDRPANHAAGWLLWHYTHSPTPAERVILQAFATDLQLTTSDSFFVGAYQVLDKASATPWLERWLAPDKIDESRSLGEFPLPIPDALLEHIRTVWMKRIIATKGRYFSEMLDFPLPLPLRRELAECTAQYYRENSELLTRAKLNELQHYLRQESLVALEKILPPPKPSPLPDQEDHILAWFTKEYLPYRRWQHEHGKEEHRQTILKLAVDFIHWYLGKYPRWLLDGQKISFQQTALLQKESQEKQILILCIILDGLPAWDAEDMRKEIVAQIPRLELLQNAYCFAPLPTVTEFAKEALLRGVPPRLVSQTLPLGQILPDDGSPLEILKSTLPRGLIFWRVSQPDKSYHYEKQSKRERQVHAELVSIIKTVKEFVENLPDSISLKIVITSDHGRLLNKRSPHRLPLPLGMQAHGRAAWGRLEGNFDEKGFAIEYSVNNIPYILIHGERFGLSEDLCIPLGEETFQNAKSGYEPYPHGGLFPEEALVPWFVFERDATLPQLDISISGSGEAEVSGVLTVTILNPSPIMFECLTVSLSHSPSAQEHGSWRIEPMKSSQFSLSIAPWPKKIDQPSARLTLRHPSGKTFQYQLSPVLEVKTLYERPDDLLKGLEL